MPEGREGREAARECFDLAQKIRATEDEAEKAVLTGQLREKVAERRAARIEADKKRIEKAEREIAKRHEAALRALEAIKERVAEADAHQAEDVEREVEALLSGKEGFPPRGPGGHFGFGRRERRPGPDGEGDCGGNPPPPPPRRHGHGPGPDFDRGPGCDGNPLPPPFEHGGPDGLGPAPDDLPPPDATPAD
jgi:hypothetical protein